MLFWTCIYVYLIKSLCSLNHLIHTSVQQCLLATRLLLWAVIKLQDCKVIWMNKSKNVFMIHDESRFWLYYCKTQSNWWWLCGHTVGPPSGLPDWTDKKKTNQSLEPTWVYWTQCSVTLNDTTHVRGRADLLGYGLFVGGRHPITWKVAQSGNTDHRTMLWSETINRKGTDFLTAHFNCFMLCWLRQSTILYHILLDYIFCVKYESEK